MNPSQIQGMLDDGSLERYTATAQAISGIWQRAVNAFIDTKARGLTPEGVMVRSYDAMRLAATAYLWARGYRPKGDDTHHTSFAAMTYLADKDGEDLAREAETFRSLRHSIQYAESTPDQLATKIASRRISLDKATYGMLSYVRRFLEKNVPELADNVLAGIP